jgi:hypothetical protein
MIAVAVVVRMLGACRMFSSCGDAVRGKLVEVMVTERERKVQCQREQRQARPEFHSRPKPPHLARIPADAHRLVML